MKNIAIVPARSGSKGLVDKNIKQLHDKPLIGYTIESALQSKMFDTVMVSTDSDQYAQIAIQFGAEVPCFRTKKTSSDEASSLDVIKEVLNGYLRRQIQFDTFCLLQPTSPFRASKDIENAYDLYVKKNAKAVVSVCEVEHSPLWCNTLPADLSLNQFVDKCSTLPRQSLSKYYRINGAIYIANVKEFLKDRNLYRNGSYAYVMKRENSLDIDTLEDFEFAEYYINKKFVLQKE